MFSSSSASLAFPLARSVFQDCVTGNLAVWLFVMWHSLLLGLLTPFSSRLTHERSRKYLQVEQIFCWSPRHPPSGFQQEVWWFVKELFSLRFFYLKCFREGKVDSTSETKPLTAFFSFFGAAKQITARSVAPPAFQLNAVFLCRGGYYLDEALVTG